MTLGAGVAACEVTGRELYMETLSFGEVISRILSFVMAEMVELASFPSECTLVATAEGILGVGVTSIFVTAGAGVILAAVVVAIAPISAGASIFVVLTLADASLVAVEVTVEGEIEAGEEEIEAEPEAGVEAESSEDRRKLTNCALQPAARVLSHD